MFIDLEGSDRAAAKLINCFKIKRFFVFTRSASNNPRERIH